MTSRRVVITLAPQDVILREPKDLPDASGQVGLSRLGPLQQAAGLFHFTSIRVLRQHLSRDVK